MEKLIISFSPVKDNPPPPQGKAKATSKTKKTKK